MNATSRAILQTGLFTDGSLSERRATESLSVSCATIWRMPKLSVLHLVEILPGAFRYPVRELGLLAERGLAGSARNT